MDHAETHEAGCLDCERARIAVWLHAKSEETEALLRVAAKRGAPEMRGMAEQYAIKTRVILEVLARMVEKNSLVLRSES